MRQKALNLLLILIAIFLGISLTRNIFSYSDKIRFYNELKAEHDQEKALNKKLKSDVSKSSDYFHIERQIREKLNLLQEDEVALIIPEITPSPTPQPMVEKKPYQMWAELFLKK
jgi:hypothetical protein